jgi:monothiol glutaredoxin
MDNPNEPAAVKPLSVVELKAWMDRGTSFHMFDVRPDGERAKAKIDVAVQLDEAGEAALRKLPKDATIVFQCHHGGRSRAAAERFLAEGYKRVYNLEGGIDAWSQQIDPSIARY